MYLCLIANKSADIDSSDSDCLGSDSPATTAKQYRTLQAFYQKNNSKDVEFNARRAFIDSDTIREEDRYDRIVEAYPCFYFLGHVRDF